MLSLNPGQIYDFEGIGSFRTKLMLKFTETDVIECDCAWWREVFLDTYEDEFPWHKYPTRITFDRNGEILKYNVYGAPPTAAELNATTNEHDEESSRNTKHDQITTSQCKKSSTSNISTTKPTHFEHAHQLAMQLRKPHPKAYKKRSQKARTQKKHNKKK